MTVVRPDIRYSEVVSRLEDVISRQLGICVDNCVRDDAAVSGWIFGPLPECGLTGPVFGYAEISDMPKLTGEKEDDFGGMPFNLCIYLASWPLNQGLLPKLRKEAGWDIEPKYIAQIAQLDGGYYAPMYQANADDFTALVQHANQIIPYIAMCPHAFLDVPVNNMGSDGHDWLSGDLRARPEKAQSLQRPWPCMVTEI